MLWGRGKERGGGAGEGGGGGAGKKVGCSTDESRLARTLDIRSTCEGTKQPEQCHYSLPPHLDKLSIRSIEPKVGYFTEWYPPSTNIWAAARRISPKRNDQRTINDDDE